MGKFQLFCFFGLLVIQTQNAFSEGSFAYGQYGNGAWAAGTSWNYKTEREAQNTAMSNCNSRGYNCQILTTFRNTCFAYAVQNDGSGFGSGFGKTQREARNVALSGCHQYGMACSVRESFCDTIQETVSTLICAHPVFAEEQRLKASLDGSDARTDYIAQAINHLRAKYCRLVEGTLESAQQEHVGDNCFQYSGYFRGELVYWGRCHE